MNPDMIITFVILAITIVVFITDKLRVDIVALLALLALVLLGIIDSKQAVAGFSNSTVLTIAALFVVGGGLFKTGVADWLGDQLLRLAGDSQVRLLVILMLGTALLSAFLSNTGTVAVLLPAVVAAAWRIKRLPSEYLMPLAFAASIGGMLTLVGTPPNIVINDTLKEFNLAPFGFFEFSLIGLPLLVVGIAYMWFIGRKWIPKRKTRDLPEQEAFSPEELAETYQLEENLYRLRVRRGSPIVGQTIGQTNSGRDYGVTIVRIDRAAEADINEEQDQAWPTRQLRTITSTFTIKQTNGDVQTPGADTILYADDVMLVDGPSKEVQRMAFDFNLGIQSSDPTHGHPEEELLSQEIGLAEIIITPRSILVGRTLPETKFSQKYGVHVLGISRRGKPIVDTRILDEKLTFGDTLLVRGTWQSIGLLQHEARNFVVVGQPQAMAKAKGLTSKSIIAILALLGMLVMLVTGVVPTVVAVIITALVMVLGGCLSMEQSYRSINWESVVLIAAMLPMSTALQVTGGAEFIANGLVTMLGAVHPLLLMAGVFVLTTSFTQVISNTATTVLVAPIAIQSAQNMGIDAHPMMMMVAVGASTAFLTPIASPVNTLVLTPGGYHFGDFMKTGLPLLILFLIISIILVPLIWGL